MWLHGAIFAVFLLALAGSRLGWLRMTEGIDERSFRLFLIAALAGNLLGTCITVKEQMKPDETFTKLAREDGRAVDATQGRKTKAVIIMENDRIVLSALLPETIRGRAQGGSDEPARESGSGEQ